MRKLPLFIAQGRDAERYSIERSCDELRLFHSAGMSVTVRQYPCGDELTTNMLSDMDRWMMEIVTGIAHKPEPNALRQASTTSVWLGSADIPVCLRFFCRQTKKECLPLRR